MDLEILKKIDLFSELTTEELSEFIKFCQMQSFPKGCTVIHQEDIGNDLYFIINGRVKVLITHEDGSEITLNMLSEGDYFGEMSGFTQMPRSATIVTEQDCDFLTISQKAFSNIIKGNSKLIMNMLKEMSIRLYEANELISSLSHLDAKGRVAKTLLKLSNSEGILSQDESVVFPRISLKEIAAMAGTSRETVSRILSDFSKRGIFEVTKEDFIIHIVAEINKFAESSPVKAANTPKIL